METYYETLKLKPGASLEEVKTAYRRLARQYHPDSAGSRGGDPIRFQEIYNAYQALNGRARPKKRDGPGSSSRPFSDGRELWRLEEVIDLGPDVIYVLRVKTEDCLWGLRLNLSWFREEACPRCLGAGYTLTPMFGGPHLSKTPCLKCQSKGIIIQEAVLVLNVSSREIEEGRLRLNGLGHYRPAQAARGDLFIKFKPEWRNSFFDPVYERTRQEAAQ